MAQVKPTRFTSSSTDLPHDIMSSNTIHKPSSLRINRSFEEILYNDKTPLDLNALPMKEHETWDGTDRRRTSGADDMNGVLRLSTEVCIPHGGVQSCNVTAESREKPFQKWISRLHRRALHHRAVLGRSRSVSGKTVPEPCYNYEAHHQRQSSSGSSAAFVTTVKSVSMSLATASLLSRSRRNTIRSSKGHSRADQSSRASLSGARLSVDNSCVECPMVIDVAAIERSLQRRRILEELISTEEGYIGDVRFLMNVSDWRVLLERDLADLLPGLHYHSSVSTDPITSPSIFYQPQLE